LPPDHLYLDRGNRGDDGDPFPGFAAWKNDLSDFLGPRSRDRYDDFTAPSSRTNDGAPTGIVVSDIRLDNLDVLCRIQIKGATAVTQTKPIAPGGIELHSRPNPAYGTFRLSGRLPAGDRAARVRIFDLLGREQVAEEILAQQNGNFEWRWENAARLPAGIYFSVVEAGVARAVRKIILLR
jgi:hypothetical protein